MTESPASLYFFGEIFLHALLAGRIPGIRESFGMPRHSILKSLEPRPFQQPATAERGIAWPEKARHIPSVGFTSFHRGFTVSRLEN